MITFVKNWFAPTFIDFACNWLEHEYARHAPVSLPKKRQLLEKSVFPFIGQKRITHVKYQDIVKIILAYRQTAPRSAKKLAQILYRIFNYANAVCDYRIDNPVKKELKLITTTPEKGGEFAVLELHELPDFFAEIDKLKVKKPETKTAFWLLSYTALRRSEVMRANWEEINFKDKVWTIPQERMKTRNAHHVIPLSPQVIDLLLLLQKQTGRHVLMSFSAIHCATCGQTAFPAALASSALVSSNPLRNP